MVETSRRHRSIHCHTVGLLLIRKSDSKSISCDGLRFPGGFIGIPWTESMVTPPSAVAAAAAASSAAASPSCRRLKLSAGSSPPEVVRRKKSASWRVEVHGRPPRPRRRRLPRSRSLPWRRRRQRQCRWRQRHDRLATQSVVTPAAAAAEAVAAAYHGRSPWKWGAGMWGAAARA